MATEMINLKLETKFLKKIDSTVKDRDYQSRTELIREAIREKIDREEIITSLKKLRGSVKKSISEQEFEKAREKAFNHISSGLK